MMTEVLQGMDQVGVELQEDLEAGLQEVGLQAVQEVVHLPVLEAEHLRTGGDPEDIMVMLLRSMMSEYILLMSLLSLYFL